MIPSFDIPRSLTEDSNSPIGGSMCGSATLLSDMASISNNCAPGILCFTMSA